MKPKGWENSIWVSSRDSSSLSKTKATPSVLGLGLHRSSYWHLTNKTCFRWLCQTIEDQSARQRQNYTRDSLDQVLTVHLHRRGLQRKCRSLHKVELEDHIPLVRDHSIPLPSQGSQCNQWLLLSSVVSTQDIITPHWWSTGVYSVEQEMLQAPLLTTLWIRECSQVI